MSSNNESIKIKSWKTHRIRTFGLIIFLIAAFIAFTVYPSGLQGVMAESSGSEDFLRIPLEDINGNTIYLEDFDGKVVVLEFMATWCLTCAQQELVLKELYPNYVSENVVVFAVTVDPTFDTVDVIKNHVESKDIPWQITRDTSLKLTRYFQVSELSTILIITPEGEVVNEFAGLTDIDTLSSAIDILL